MPSLLLVFLTVRVGDFRSLAAHLGIGTFHLADDPPALMVLDLQERDGTGHATSLRDGIVRLT